MKKSETVIGLLLLNEIYSSEVSIRIWVWMVLEAKVNENGAIRSLYETYLRFQPLLVVQLNT